MSALPRFFHINAHHASPTILVCPLTVSVILQLSLASYASAPITALPPRVRLSSSALPLFLCNNTHHLIIFITTLMSATFAAYPTRCSLTITSSLFYPQLLSSFGSPLLPMHQRPSLPPFRHTSSMSTVAVILRLSLASYASAPVTALPPHVRSLSSFKFSSPSLHMRQHPSSYHLHRYPHISDHCCLSYSMFAHYYFL